MLEKCKISSLNTQTFALENVGGMWTPTCPDLPCPGQRVFLEICPVSCPVDTSGQECALFVRSVPCSSVEYCEVIGMIR